MKPKVCLIGVGMGNPATLTAEAERAIEACPVLVGAPRLLEPYQKGKNCVPLIAAADILAYIETCGESPVGVLLSGVVLAFCGQIGFVGLIVPHLSRRLAGSDYRRLSPASALLGAIVMVLVYDAAYFTGFTSSINLLTSLAGGVVFLVFLLGYRRRRNADWA